MNPLTATPVTIWKRYNDGERIWEHNHIEVGHVQPEQQYPLPIVDCKVQRSWANGAWLKTHAYLIGGIVKRAA